MGGEPASSGLPPRLKLPSKAGGAQAVAAQQVGRKGAGAFDDDDENASPAAARGIDPLRSRCTPSRHQIWRARKAPRDASRGLLSLSNALRAPKTSISGEKRGEACARPCPLRAAVDVCLPQGLLVNGAASSKRRRRGFSLFSFSAPSSSHTLPPKIKNQNTNRKPLETMLSLLARRCCPPPRSTTDGWPVSRFVFFFIFSSSLGEVKRERKECRGGGEEAPFPPLPITMHLYSFAADSINTFSFYFRDRESD